METLIHADIFFLVTTVVVVAIGIVGAVALSYLLLIFRDVKYITKKIKAESDEVIEDLRVLRTSIKEHGFKLGMVTSLFSKFLPRKKRSKKSE